MALFTLQDLFTRRNGDQDPVHIPDFDCYKDNPIEAKFRKLARSHRITQLDRELKPNAKLRNEISVSQIQVGLTDCLQNIVHYPCTKPLNNIEKDLLWRFRFFLAKDKKASETVYIVVIDR
jgi:phosphatidylinositol 3-kinase